jgi:hypothetical protein
MPALCGHIFLYCHDVFLLCTVRSKYRVIRCLPTGVSMAGNDSGRYWDPLVMQQELTPVEKQLRDNFVTEYLKDYDAWKAAVRIGYLRTVAHEYASFLMQEPYVQREIARRQAEHAPNQKENEKHERHMVKQWLIEQARYQGPGSSHSARVSALAKLCNILDMDGTTKVKADVMHKGGVMMVPAIASLEDWEKQAAKSQDELIASSSEDRSAKPVH